MGARRCGDDRAASQPKLVHERLASPRRVPRCHCAGWAARSWRYTGGGVAGCSPTSPENPSATSRAKGGRLRAGGIEHDALEAGLDLDLDRPIEVAPFIHPSVDPGAVWDRLFDPGPDVVVATPVLVSAVHPHHRGFLEERAQSGEPLLAEFGLGRGVRLPLPLSARRDRLPGGGHHANWAEALPLTAPGSGSTCLERAVVPPGGAPCKDAAQRDGSTSEPPALIAPCRDIP